MKDLFFLNITLQISGPNNFKFFLNDLADVKKDWMQFSSTFTTTCVESMDADHSASLGMAKD